MAKLPTGKPMTATVLEMFYTYIWRDSSGVPFYVGKGKRKRAWNTSQRSAAFKEIYEHGGCAVEIVDLFIHESQAHAHEMELIDFYGRRDNGSGTLVNLTDGGEGTTGAVLSAETRERIAKAALGRNPSAEQRAKISEANRGKKLSPEHIARLVEANRGRSPSEETKAKIGAANRGNKYALGVTRSAETKAKISEAKLGTQTRLGAILTLETREKISASLRGKPLSPGHRAKLSDVSRGKPKTPQHVANVSDALRMCPPREGAASVFKGVSTNRTTWVARIYVSGVRRTIGYFSTDEDAARAYDAAAIEAWGIGNCYLNFPEPEGKRA